MSGDFKSSYVICEEGKIIYVDGMEVQKLLNILTLFKSVISYALQWVSESTENCCSDCFNMCLVLSLTVI